MEDTLTGNQQEKSKSECVGSRSRALGSRLREMEHQRDQAFVNAFEPQPLMFYNPTTCMRWIRPIGLSQLCSVLRDYSADAIQIVGGNTSVGVTKYLNDSAPYNTADAYNTFVDVNCVPEMTAQNYNPTTRELVVGAATSLTRLVALLQTYSTKEFN